jgi:hypothetical protein
MAMKTVRTAPPKPQTWQPAKRFTPPAPGPQHQGLPAKPSNECAAHAVRVAGKPGSIDPRQQVY